MKIYDTMEQSSPEWHEIRLGKVTASKFSAVMAGGKGKTRLAYMRQLAAEKLTGESQVTFSNQNMENGSILESEAREYYESVFNVKVKQVGFVAMNNKIGCSPDGFVGKCGLVEIKCVLPATQIATILGGGMPSVHSPQVQGQLWVTGRTWCDFVSYCPAIKSRPFFCVRIYRDLTYFEEILSPAIIKFTKELRKMLKEINVNQF